MPLSIQQPERINLILLAIITGKLSICTPPRHVREASRVNNISKNLHPEGLYIFDSQHAQFCDLLEQFWDLHAIWYILLQPRHSVNLTNPCRTKFRSSHNCGWPAVALIPFLVSLAFTRTVIFLYSLKVAKRYVIKLRGDKIWPEKEPTKWTTIIGTVLEPAAILRRVMGKMKRSAISWTTFKPFKLELRFCGQYS